MMFLTLCLKKLKTECSEALETARRENPARTKRKPGYLQDYDTECNDNLQMCVDFCYRAVCDLPNTYQEALASAESEQWKMAMEEEMKSLIENETFTLTKLPADRKAVGGKWVYTPKTNANGTDKHKTRFVAKGYSQKEGTDFKEMFSPTAEMTSVREVIVKGSTGRFKSTSNGC